MNELSNVPEWLGVAVLNAVGWLAVTIWTLISGLLGAIFKAIWDAWKYHRLPFKKDKEQFESLITKENAQIVKFFRENNNPFIENSILDALEQFQEKLDDPYWPDHQNGKLKLKRKSLANAVKSMDEFLRKSTQLHVSGGGVILPEDEDRKKRYFNRRDDFVKAFESYRDYGAKLFSVKISKDAQNG